MSVEKTSLEPDSERQDSPLWPVRGWGSVQNETKSSWLTPYSWSISSGLSRKSGYPVITVMCFSWGQRKRRVMEKQPVWWYPTAITVCAHLLLDPAARTRIPLIKQAQCNRITGNLFYSARPSKRIRTSDCKSIKEGYLAAQTLNQHHGKIWIRALALLNVKPLVYSIINLHLTKRSIKPCGKTGTSKKQLKSFQILIGSGRVLCWGCPGSEPLLWQPPSLFHPSSPAPAAGGPGSVLCPLSAPVPETQSHSYGNGSENTLK